jgi:hypothetical protein
MACLIRPPSPLRYTAPNVVAQLRNSNDPATMTPSRTMRTREWLPAGEVGNTSTAITASGTAAKKPTSASDGNGTVTPLISSYHDHTA